MMGKLRHRLPALLLALAFAQTLWAQTAARNITVRLDPEQTQIHWTLGDVLHTVHGTFRLKGGTVSFNLETGAAHGELVVDLDTGDSGDSMRDRRMKKSVLETDKYPEAIFRPQTVSGKLQPGSAQQIAVDGTFTIHGTVHPLRLIICAQMPGAGHITASTQFLVPYVAWGMKDPSTFVLRVGKQVTVDVQAQGTVEGVQ